ncbi:helix-turn-helix domain-containing protein [Longispora urticae]
MMPMVHWGWSSIGHRHGDGPSSGPERVRGGSSSRGGCKLGRYGEGFAGRGGAFNVGDAIERVPGLSDREREVLELLGSGLSNREIANALTVGERTARAHVERVLLKLSVASRSQAGIVGYAVRRQRQNGHGESANSDQRSPRTRLAGTEIDSRGN